MTFTIRVSLSAWLILPWGASLALPCALVMIRKNQPIATSAVPYTLLVTTWGWKYDLEVSSHRRETSSNPLIQNQTGSPWQAINPSAQNWKSLYFYSIQTRVSVNLIIHLLLGFPCAGGSINFILGQAVTSMGEMLHFIYRMGEWGQFWAERVFKEEKAMQELDASVIAVGYSAQFALNVFLVMNHPKSCQKKMLCPERNPSPLTLAFMLIWAQKVERAEFSALKCDKTENITFFGVNERGKSKTVSS